MKIAPYSPALYYMTPAACREGHKYGPPTVLHYKRTGGSSAPVYGRRCVRCGHPSYQRHTFGGKGKPCAT